MFCNNISELDCQWRSFLVFFGEQIPMQQNLNFRKQKSWTIWFVLAKNSYHKLAIYIAGHFLKTILCLAKKKFVLSSHLSKQQFR